MESQILQVLIHQEIIFESPKFNPLDSFSSIQEAILDVQNGKFVVVVDNEDRENEGDLIIAGQGKNKRIHVKIWMKQKLHSC